MPMFECKACREEWVGFDGGVSRCPKCGKVAYAPGFKPEARSGGGGLRIGMSPELEERLGIKPDPPKGGGFGCAIAIVVIIVIVWLMGR